VKLQSDSSDDRFMCAGRDADPSQDLPRPTHVVSTTHGTICLSSPPPVVSH
jgi:hypothetical protein